MKHTFGVVVSVAALVSGCVSPDYVTSRQMAYAQCNETTSAEWAKKHASSGFKATQLGIDVEQHCRIEARAEVTLENQLLNALENARRIESASEAR